MNGHQIKVCLFSILFTFAHLHTRYHHRRIFNSNKFPFVFTWATIGQMSHCCSLAGENFQYSPKSKYEIYWVRQNISDWEFVKFHLSKFAWIILFDDENDVVLCYVWKIHRCSLVYLCKVFWEIFFHEIMRQFRLSEF